MPAYCSKCGGNHSVGNCPSLSNKDFNAQQAARIRDATASANSRAGGMSPPPKKGCLGILITALLIAVLVLTAILSAL